MHGGLSPAVRLSGSRDLPSATRDVKSSGPLPPPPRLRDSTCVVDSFVAVVLHDSRSFFQMGTGDSLVSFVFGLEVTWGLLQVQLEQEAEGEKGGQTDERKQTGHHLR